MANEYKLPTIKYDNTYQDYIHVRSTSKGGADTGIIGIDDLIVPSSPNWPSPDSTGGASNYYCYLDFNFDVTALGGARPISVRNETQATDLTLVTSGSAVLTAMQCRILPVTSKMRNFIEIHVGVSSSSANDVISIEGYVDSYVIQPHKANLLQFKNIAVNETLSPNITNYVNHNLSVTLPATNIEVNDKIKIVTNYKANILQSDAEEVIKYKNKYTTTKGTGGLLAIGNKMALEMIYRGADTYKSGISVKLADPGTLPASNGHCAFSYDGNYLAVAHANSPYITIYKRSGDTFTKLADPGTLPAGNGISCAFSYDGTYLAVAHYTSPYITIYKRSGDTFTKLTNPVTLPTGSGYGCAFSYDGNYLVVSHLTAPCITIYKRSGDTFTKLSDPGTLPTNYANACAFSYDGNYLAVAYSDSPYVIIYKRSGDTFTKLADPGTLPAGSAGGCAFSYDGNYLAVSHWTSPYITIYRRTGDTFTKLANPATLPAGNGSSCSFSYDGNYLAVGHWTSPFITIYRLGGDTFTKLADPATLPAGKGLTCSFSHDGNYLAVGCDASPYIAIYSNYLTASKVWEIINLDTLYETDKEYMFK